MVELFQTTKQNISLHIKNIFEERELIGNSVVKDFLTTASDGKNYNTKYKEKTKNCDKVFLFKFFLLLFPLKPALVLFHSFRNNDQAISYIAQLLPLNVFPDSFLTHRLPR